MSNKDDQEQRTPTQLDLLVTPKTILQQGGKEAAIVLSIAVLILSLAHLIGVLVPVMRQSTRPSKCLNTELTVRSF